MSRTRFGGGGSKGGDPTETIIAIVIGGVTLVVIVVIIIVFCCCCPRRSCLKCKKTKTRKDRNDFVDHTTLTPGSRTQPVTELCDYAQPQTICPDNPLAFSKTQDFPSAYSKSEDTAIFTDRYNKGYNKSFQNGTPLYRPIQSNQIVHETSSDSAKSSCEFCTEYDQNRGILHFNTLQSNSSLS